MPRNPATPRDVPCKDWCFTTFVVDDPRILPNLEWCEYIMYQPEVCPETQRPHLQGFLICLEKKSFAQIKVLLPGFHLERRKGTRTQARVYCMKTTDGGSGQYIEHGVFAEVGDAGGAAQKRKYEDNFELAKVGDYKSMCPEFQFRFLRAAKEIAFLHLPQPVQLDAPCGVWVHGITGSGKTHYVTTLVPAVDLYLKTVNKWWDNYTGQEAVLIDEVDPSNCKYMADKFKKWTDKYIFPAEFKGGMCNLRPKKVYITSQFTIEQCFPLTEDAEAVRRRCQVIHVVRPFPAPADPTSEDDLC